MIDMPPDPPAIHFVIPAPPPPPKPAFDHDRLIRAIIAIENTPWSKPGGALGFQIESWFEETSLPFRLASNPAQAKIIAKIRLARFAVKAISRGVEWTPILACESWRWGIDDALAHAKRKRFSSYGKRAFNLFNDPTFQ